MSDERKLLRVETRGSTLWLTLDRADKANALTLQMLHSTSHEIEQARADGLIRAIVLTGAGERVFCAGVDIKELPVGVDPKEQRTLRSAAQASLQDTVMDSPIPVIAALNGLASGAGAMLALLADACVAVDTASISLPEIDIGIATFSGASIVDAIAGRALAKDLVQTGRRMPAGEGVALGLINEAVPRAQLESAASAMAEKLGAKNPAAFADNKRWINRGVKSALAEAREEHARHRAGSPR